MPHRDQPFDQLPPAIGGTTKLGRTDTTLSESMALSALAGSGDAVWEWDVNSGTFSVGIDSTTFSAHLATIHPDDTEKYLQAVNQASDDGSGRLVVEYRISVDSRWIWVVDRAQVIRGASNQPMRMIGTRTDISVRREWEERLCEVAKNLRNGHIVSKTASISFNPMSSEQVGSDEYDCLIGSPSVLLPDYPDHVHIEDRDRVRLAIHRLLSSRQRVEIEHRLLSAGGLEKNILLVADVAGTWISATFLDVTDRRQVDRALRKLDEQFRTAIESSFDTFMLLEAITNESGKVVDFEFRHLNHQSENLTLRPAAVLIGRKVSGAMLPRKFARFFVQYRRVLKYQKRLDEEIQMGDSWYLHRAVPVDNSVAISISDITRQKANETALRDQQRFVEQIARSSPDLICLDDIAKNLLLYSNRSVLSILDRGEFEATKCSSTELWPWVHKDDLQTFEALRDQVLHLSDDSFSEVRVRMVTANGKHRWIACRDSVFARDETGTPTQILASYRDVTIQKEHEDRLEAMASTDALTGVFNRRHFQDRLRAEIERADRYGSALSLVIVDIDNFKTYNDRFGHQFGDEVLKEFAQILLQSVRLADIVARYGGEEFAVILPVTTVDEAGLFCERVRQKLGSTEFGVHRVKVTGSFGGAQHRKGPRALEDLIARADAVQYYSKKNGKDRVTIDRPTVE